MGNSQRCQKSRRVSSTCKHSFASNERVAVQTKDVERLGGTEMSSRGVLLRKQLRASDSLKCF